MNPFQAHANLMGQYNAFITNPPLSGDVKENSIDYAGANYPATIGHFMRRNVLTEGGWRPMLLGEAIVQKAVLTGANPLVVFAVGQKLTAHQVGGAVRACQISAVDDEFGEWRLELWDVSEKA